MMMPRSPSASGSSVHIEDGNLGAGRGQHARGGGAEAGAPAGDEGRVSTYVHGQLACAVGILKPPATMTFGGGGSA